MNIAERHNYLFQHLHFLSQNFFYKKSFYNIDNLKGSSLKQKTNEATF